MRNGTFTLLLGIKSQYDAWQSSKARRLDRVLGKLFRYTKKNYKQKHRALYTAQTEGKTIEKKKQPTKPGSYEFQEYGNRMGAQMHFVCSKLS